MSLLAENWVVDFCSIKGGFVTPLKRVTPRNFSFSKTLSAYGNGSITFLTSVLREVRFLPAESVVIFSRISGHGASPLNPVIEFAGIPTELSFNSTRTATFGLLGVDKWLESAASGDKVSYKRIPQELLAEEMVNSWVPAKRRPGIRAKALTKTTLRDRLYLPGQRIGSALKNLSGVIGGPEFRTVYFRGDYGEVISEIQISDSLFSETEAHLHDKNSKISVRLSSLGQANFAISTADISGAVGSDTKDPSADAGARVTVQRTSYEHEDSLMFAVSPTLDQNVSLGLVSERLEGALTYGSLAKVFASVSTPGVPSRDTFFDVGDTVFLSTSASGVSLGTSARIIAVDWTVSDSNTVRQISVELPSDVTYEITG